MLYDVIDSKGRILHEALSEKAARAIVAHMNADQRSREFKGGLYDLRPHKSEGSSTK